MITIASAECNASWSLFELSVSSVFWKRKSFSLFQQRFLYPPDWIQSSNTFKTTSTVDDNIRRHLEKWFLPHRTRQSFCSMKNSSCCLCEVRPTFNTGKLEMKWKDYKWTQVTTMTDRQKENLFIGGISSKQRMNEMTQNLSSNIFAVWLSSDFDVG